jgi:hypothetical protein
VVAGRSLQLLVIHDGRHEVVRTPSAPGSPWYALDEVRIGHEIVALVAKDCVTSTQVIGPGGEQPPVGGRK